MIAHRRRFCPSLENSLEPRAVLTHILSLPAAVSILHGTQIHPTIALTESASRTPTYQFGNTPSGFNFKATLDKAAIPQLTAAEKANLFLNTYKVIYHNGRSKNYPWAAISVKLDRGLHYVPGTVVAPAGGKLTVSTDSNDIQTLTFILPYGIPSGSSGFVAFQTKYSPPPYDPINA